MGNTCGCHPALLVVMFLGAVGACRGSSPAGGGVDAGVDASPFSDDGGSDARFAIDASVPLSIDAAVPPPADASVPLPIDASVPPPADASATPDAISTPDGPLPDAGVPDADITEAVATIPGGGYFRGCNQPVDPSCADDEKPGHFVQLSTFEIDLTEVTQERYQECVVAGVCTAPPMGYSPLSTPRLPVTDVNWFQARDYCQWRGKRLPTEAEWEVGARGDDARTYPWGNTAPTCALVVMLGCDTDDPLPVGSSELGRSPFGLYDMAGNAVEWVSDNYDGTFYTDYAISPYLDPTGPSGFGAKVFRGGSVRYNKMTTTGSLRSSDRYVDGATAQYLDLGFRCASDAP